jgi:hypothetical protein
VHLRAERKVPDAVTVCVRARARARCTTLLACSGKSAVVDAIVWVLGGSHDELRAQKASAFINDTLEEGERTALVEVWFRGTGALPPPHRRVFGARETSLILCYK